MTEVHHQTRKSADDDLAKRNISPGSHKAVHGGRLSLAEARKLGRNGSSDRPPKPQSRNSKNDRSRLCLACGGTVPTGNRFHQGCDMKMHRLATEYVRGERELSEEAVEYITESGKLDRARDRVVEEDHAAALREHKQRGKQSH